MYIQYVKNCVTSGGQGNPPGRELTCSLKCEESAVGKPGLVHSRPIEEHDQRPWERHELICSGEIKGLCAWANG